MAYTDATECYAVPGKDSIIDVINPATGLTAISANTEAEVLARAPEARRMRISDFIAEKAARQHTPIEWVPTTQEKYHEMLEVLPPAYWVGGAFLVGEPSDHDAATGLPRFAGYRQIAGGYFVASRPLTIAEMREERKKAL